MKGHRTAFKQGFSRYTLLLFNKLFVHTHHHYVHILKTKTVRTEVMHTGIPFAYGILVKNDDDYGFLSDFITDNRDVINTCNGLLINSYSFESAHEHGEHEHNPLFSTSGKVFWTTMSIISILLLLICTFGVVYELKRRILICQGHCDGEKLVRRNVFSTLFCDQLFQRTCCAHAL